MSDSRCVDFGHTFKTDAEPGECPNCFKDNGLIEVCPMCGTGIDPDTKACPECKETVGASDQARALETSLRNSFLCESKAMQHTRAETFLRCAIMAAEIAEALEVMSEPRKGTDWLVTAKQICRDEHFR